MGKDILSARERAISIEIHVNSAIIKIARSHLYPEAPMNITYDRQMDKMEIMNGVANPETVESLSLEKRHAFMALHLKQRRRLLAAQAEAMVAHYQQYPEWQELLTGDILDY
ncbi:MAG: hypothetical protein AB4352_17305 [Hormoscilla sp.]